MYRLQSCPRVRWTHCATPGRWALLENQITLCNTIAAQWRFLVYQFFFACTSYSLFRTSNLPSKQNKNAKKHVKKKKKGWKCINIFSFHHWITQEFSPLLHVGRFCQTQLGVKSESEQGVSMQHSLLSGVGDTGPAQTLSHSFILGLVFSFQTLEGVWGGQKLLLQF